MAFTVPQFPLLTPAQANPYGGLFDSIIDAYSKSLSARYLPETLKQSLLQTQLANQKSQAELPYAADLARANAASRLAYANYMLGPNAALKGLSPLAQNLVEPYAVPAIQKQITARANQLQQSGGDIVNTLYPSVQQSISPQTDNISENTNPTNVPPRTMHGGLPLGKYSSLSQDEQRGLVDQAVAFGYTPQQAVASFRSGADISQLAKNAGYSDQSKWPAPVSSASTDNVSSANPDNIKQLYEAKIQKITSDPKIRSQAIESQLLAKDINKINVKPLEAFSGLSGKGELLKNQWKQALGLEPSKEYREYQKFIDVNKPLIIDQVRKALATSIQSKYVLENITPLVDPNNKIYSDPVSVRNAIEVLKTWSNERAKFLTDVVKKGVDVNFKPYENKSNTNTKNSSNSSEQKIYFSPILGKKITQKDLEHTADQNGLSIDKVKSDFGIE